jgi:hypothetical protein
MCHEPARKEKNGRGRNGGRINQTQYGYSVENFRVVQ